MIFLQVKVDAQRAYMEPIIHFQKMRTYQKCSKIAMEFLLLTLKDYFQFLTNKRSLDKSLLVKVLMKKKEILMLN